MQNSVDALDKSFGSVEGILINTGVRFHSMFAINDSSTLVIRNLLTGYESKCYFPSYLSEDAQNATGKRVVVFGLIFSNEAGEKVWVSAEGLEVFPSEEELPPLEDIIGILD